MTTTKSQKAALARNAARFPVGKTFLVKRSCSIPIFSGKVVVTGAPRLVPQLRFNAFGGTEETGRMEVQIPVWCSVNDVEGLLVPRLLVEPAKLWPGTDPY